MNSQIDPTYLRYIYDGLSKGNISLENEAALPEGLVGLYEEAFNESIPAHKRQKTLEYFAMWALLKKEVSCSFFAEILNTNEEEVADFIASYAAWFNSPESGKYQLYHERLKVYLLQKLSEKEVHELHEKLITRLEQAIENQKADEFEWYALEFLGNEKFVKAIIKGKEFDFIQFSLDPKIWHRQRQISKDFVWSKKMVGEAMLYKILKKDDGLQVCIFSLLKIGWDEQNEYQEILNLAEEKEFELCRQRLYFFGGKSLLEGKRRFLLALLIIERILTVPLDDDVEKSKNVKIFLEFIENEISAEKYLFNWNEFIPLSYILSKVILLMKIDVSPLALINKTNKLEFNNQCSCYINKSNLYPIFECIEKSNLNQIDKYSSQINLCEFAIKIGIDNNLIKSCLFELLSKSEIVQKKVGSKFYYRQLISSLLLTDSYNEIVSSFFFESPEFEVILFEAVSLHILKHPKCVANLIDPLISKFNNSYRIHVLNSLVAFVFNSNEVEFFKDESFKALANRNKLLLDAFIYLKNNDTPKSKIYWSQLMSELRNESALTVNSSFEKDFLYIIETLLDKECFFEIQNLIDTFNNLLKEEFLLKLIAVANSKDSKYVSEILLIKQQNLEEHFSDPIFCDSLIAYCIGDTASAFSNIGKIDNILHKDFLFKLLLQEVNIDKRLIDSYLKFNFFVSKVKTSDSKTEINALKYLEELKLNREGKINLFELKKNVEQFWKKPVYFFQYSQSEYLHEIISIFIKKGKLEYAQKFKNVEKDHQTSDLLLFETNKAIFEKKKSALDIQFIRQFQTKKMKWQAQQFIATIQYQSGGSIQEALNTLSNIDSISQRIQGYFNCLEVSIDKNKFHHLELFDLIEMNLNKLGEGDVLQKGKDKFSRFNILTKNSFLMLKINKNDFLINELKLFSLKDRFLAYLKIAEICRINNELEVGIKFFRRVINQLNKIEQIQDRIELRCEIIELSSKFNFTSSLNDSILYLKDIVRDCNDNRKKSEYALKIILSCIKVKLYKKGYEFYSYLSNYEDKLELIRFIGSLYKSSMLQIHLSELNYFINSTSGFQELAKSKIAKLKIDECSESNLSFSYFVMHDNKTLYSLFVGWFLNELFFRQTPLEDLIEYSEVLNLQWAIDLKNELDQIPN